MQIANRIYADCSSPVIVNDPDSYGSIRINIVVLYLFVSGRVNYPRYGVTVMALRGHGFYSRPSHCRVTTLDKSIT